MVCNVDHFLWPLEDCDPIDSLESSTRPLLQDPHPDTPYVVLLLKMLSSSDDAAPPENFRR
ncbi:hypothetical protein GC197_15010 [bacterium]|nr:hypothetical protein [bacterium]